MIATVQQPKDILKQRDNHNSYIMMTDSSIPVMNKPVDMMEVGPNGNNLQAAARKRHPVEVLQRQQGKLLLIFFFFIPPHHVNDMTKS